MAIFLLLTFAVLKLCSGEDYKIIPINSSSGLYYEKIGHVLLSNNNWEFVTSVDYKGYLLFYQYLQDQAMKIQDFCKMYEDIGCRERLGGIQGAMKLIRDKDELISNYFGLKNRRRKRTVADVINALGPDVLRPLSEGLAYKLFGKQETPDLSAYESQLAELKERQENFYTQLNTQTTLFKVDSEDKENKIKTLQHIQTKLEFDLKIQNETSQNHSVENEKKIVALKTLLSECEEDIKKLQEDELKIKNEVNGLKDSVKTIDEDLEFLNKQLNLHKNRTDVIEIVTKLNSISINFNTLSSLFLSEQKILLDSLVNSNRGFLDPYVITPLSLIEMMLNAEPKLPEGYKFPYYPNFENARKLYNLITSEYYLYNGKIIWILKMNLVKAKQYDLFKITSLPFSVDGNIFGFVLPRQPYMLVDRAETEYSLFSDSDFHISCKYIEEGAYLCTRIQTYAAGSNMDCEIGIFLNTEINPDDCQIRLISLKDPIFLQLLEHKTWIYASGNPSDLTLTCNHFRKVEAIIKSGILRLNDCNAFNNQLAFESYMDPRIPMIYSNFTSSLNVGKFVKYGYNLPSSKHKGIFLPYNYDDLKGSSISLNEISSFAGDNEHENSYNWTYYFFIIIPIAIVVGFFSVYLVKKLTKSSITSSDIGRHRNETTEHVSNNKLDLTNKSCEIRNIYN